MALKRTEIGNGIFLTVIPCDKFKTNYISVEFVSQMSSEDVAKNALLPFVLVRGTKFCPDIASITRKLDMLYGSSVAPHVYKVGDAQIYGFASYPLREEYAQGCDVTAGVLSFIGEMLCSPALENGVLRSDYVESEKRIMTDRIRAKINDKDSYAMLRCRQEMAEGGDAALPETGTESQVAEINALSLTKQLEKIKRADRVEIFAVGVFDERRLTSSCKEIFCGIERDSAVPITTSPLKKRNEPKAVTEPQPVKQGKLSIGYSTDCTLKHPDAAAFSLFVNVLGGSPVSKLFTNVREKQSLCYYCAAIPDLHKGSLLIASGIEVQAKEAAEKAIAEQIDACVRGDISEQEISAAKSAIINGIKSMYDDAGAIKSWYLRRSLMGLSEDPLKYADRISALGIEDIKRAAASVSLNTVYFLEGTLLQEEAENE